ncbi:hypothetical protein C484_20217 [Natrialba taiwanensis DSM 12281]|uniref:Uncharacterized protein n=1 Tax=Natrialba taiwanensis DSM 12281 TaxID=1230458 RepID=L9ZKF1_9EURY|nr:hypothetical protein C484_20217 [Natrialba taiwanensis DSM 12281]
MTFEFLALVIGQLAADFEMPVGRSRIRSLPIQIVPPADETGRADEQQYVRRPVFRTDEGFGEREKG